MLLPSSDSGGGQAMESFAKELWQRGQQAGKAAVKTENHRSAPISSPAAGNRVKPLPQEDEEDEPSFFTLQVATYDVEADAREEVLWWQAKGQDSFFLPPMEGADYFRVFIGHYTTLSEANEKVNSFADNPDVQAFITLLPAQKVGR